MSRVSITHRYAHKHPSALNHETIGDGIASPNSTRKAKYRDTESAFRNRLSVCAAAVLFVGKKTFLPEVLFRTPPFKLLSSSRSLTINFIGHYYYSPPPIRSFRARQSVGGLPIAPITLSRISSQCRDASSVTTQRNAIPALQEKTSNGVSFFSPAKVNLFLRILRRRPEDNMHELASLFHTISLGDTLTFEVLPKTSSTGRGNSCNRTGDHLICNVEGVPTDERNLVARALEKYRRASGKKDQFLVHILKRIPAEAGLGGGSSDCATALFAANQLSAGDRLSMSQLKELATQIGADCAFFLSSGAALCTGTGADICDLSQTTTVTDDKDMALHGLAHNQTPVDNDNNNNSSIRSSQHPLHQILSQSTHPTDTGRKSLASLCGNILYVIRPPMGLSTAKVYKALDCRNVSEKTPESLMEGFYRWAAYLNLLRGGDGTNEREIGDSKVDVSQFLINDLEGPAFACLPELRRIKEDICTKAAGGTSFQGAMMSGSGTALFRLTTDYEGTLDEDLNQETDSPQRQEEDSSSSGSDIKKSLQSLWPGTQVYRCKFIVRKPGEWYKSTTTP